MKIYFDGSGWNGKESRYCVVFETGRQIVKVFPEKRTNNEMEYAGLLEALDHAKPGDELFTDSQLVERQVKGTYKVKAQHLKESAEKARRALKEKNAKLTWIPREQNLAGKLFE